MKMMLTSKMRGSVVAFAFMMIAGAAPRCGAALVGQWTFENGSLADSTGNFEALVLQGDATISNGALDVNGAGTNASGWASTSGSGGVAIGAKTLVSWITLQSLSEAVVAGSAMTIDSTTFDQFDGIVFAERDANRWMSGSNGFSRTPASFSEDSALESSTGTMIQLAITYEDVAGTARITGYRNGVLMGTYDSGPFATWAAGNQEIIFGKRHLSDPTNGPGALDALIHEARLYDTALTQAQIQALQLTVPTDSDADDLLDQWEMTHAGNLTDLNGKGTGPGPGAGSGDFDGDGLLDKDEQTRVTNPVNPDTDGDTLTDGAEVAGAGARPPTSPTKSDTDNDGLSDLVESHDGTFNSATDTGTNPVVADSDGDGFSDGTEVNSLHTNPLNASEPGFSASLIGHWTFEPGSDLKDLKGNFPDLVLQGDATIIDGALDVNGAATNASGWAATSGSGGVAVGSKTLVSWITLQSLSDVAVAGSAMTLDSTSIDKFDGIVFAERDANRWMSGSSNFNRSPPEQFDQSEVAVETTTGNRIMLAVTYQDLGGGQVQITGYRDGVPMGTYSSGSFATWTAGEQEVIFGKRHLFSPTDGPGALDALIHEARLYGKAATAAEIMSLFNAGPIGGEELAFTSIVYNAAAGTADVTWVSKPGKTYRLEYSSDLATWIEETDSWPPGGATGVRTSYRFQNIPPGDRRRFFQATEE
jgi:Concanavalin A-like lectin/glucanases superfamily/Bacterial TSP3 repeat